MSEFQGRKPCESVRECLLLQRAEYLRGLRDALVVVDEYDGVGADSVRARIRQLIAKASPPKEP